MEKAKENNKKSVEAHTTHCKTPDFVKKRTKKWCIFCENNSLKQCGFCEIQGNLCTDFVKKEYICNDTGSQTPY